VRRDAHPVSADKVGAGLGAARRWGPLLLLALVSNLLVATVAWFVVGLVLEWIVPRGG
jgi:hypothetical protein